MPIAISDDHLTLASTASDFLEQRGARAGARAALEASGESLPDFWTEMVALGWLGLHVPEELGGSGFGLEELVVVIEELGRAVAPGPFVPTVVASALLVAADEDVRARFVPGLVDGSVTAGIALDSTIEVSGGTVSGQADVLGGGLAQLLVLASGDDVVVVEAGNGVNIDVPPNLDPSRRAAKVTLESAPALVLAGARRSLVDLARLLLSADAVGVASECTRLAADYAREREQFGRPIATFQAVKHHCANMAVATELATSAVWDAGRASTTGGDQFRYAAAAAATLAAPAADLCANLSTQVHGGIAITWESDLHLYMRRATALLTYLDPSGAATDLTELSRQGVTRAKAVELPPEAEQIRTEVRAFIAEIEGLPADERLERLIE
ncbi:MAG: acyl-CoA/acyl-ACP dehydrogenase, partial [Acidimicrobiia bacterium]|nr:acyl-CoA/acyl-ACP dehydrogenase [Acidimicrobiia bacterium]